MVHYIFGLSNPKTKVWITNEWNKFKSKNVDDFIMKKLLTDGPHILPLFSTSAEELKIRKRYFDYLSKALTKKEMTKILKSELDTIRLILNKKREK